MEIDEMKTSILLQVNLRNLVYNKFSTLINAHHQLYARNRELLYHQKKHKQEVEQLKQENHDLANKAHVGAANVEKSAQVSQLEQKLFRVQEELTEVHRTKGSRAQQIIDLNVALQEKEKEVFRFNDLLKTKDNETKTLGQKVSDLEQKIEDQQQANQTLKDEYQALHITYESVDAKLRQCQIENRDLVERWMRYKHTEAEQLNSDNLKFKNNLDKRNSIETSTLQNKEQGEKGNNSNPASPTIKPLTNSASQSSFKNKVLDFFGQKSRIIEGDEENSATRMNLQFCTAIVRLPNEPVCKWKAHEGEVSATRFSISGGLLATGGSDRFINIWNFIGDKSRLLHTLRGSNGGITSIDFDPHDQVLAASSNDYATRLWSLGTQRLRLTLTGHSGKVLASCFLGSATKLASGGSDRTVKIWDIRSGACTRTFMAGSSCNDIVSADSNDCLASGHFDRKIRVWDARISGHSVQNEVVVGGRVTSLDMPLDKTQLVCCTKDHTIELVDLRKSAVLKVFSDDLFKVATDQTRCACSPDGDYVAVGSSDGSVLSWNVKTGERESLTKEHNDPVITCNWSGGKLVTGDKNKICVLWSE